MGGVPSFGTPEHVHCKIHCVLPVVCVERSASCKPLPPLPTLFLCEGFLGMSQAASSRVAVQNGGGG